MIADPNFSLDLESHWVELPGGDPARYGFRDEVRDLTIAITSIAAQTAPTDMDAVAALFADEQIDAERQRARTMRTQTTIYEPIIAAQTWGRAIVGYGHDDTGRQFSFAGSLTASCIISVNGWSGILSEQQMFEVMDEVLARIVFDHTALPPSSQPC